jgi:hypothetical protein
MVLNYDSWSGISSHFSGVKVKVKLSLCLTKHHAMTTYWGGGGIAQRNLELSSKITFKYIKRLRR